MGIDTKMPDRRDIFFQSHRGGINERPENTMRAYLYSWSLKGAIPEVDVRTSKDERLVCIHDDCLFRTTNAGTDLAYKKIRDLSIKEIKSCDAGIVFDKKYKGEKIPELKEVLAELKKDKNREVYIDVKNADIPMLYSLINEFDAGRQIIFVHEDITQCKRLSSLYKGARCMTWLQGSETQITDRFNILAQTGFDGLTQIQLHLHALETNKIIQYNLSRDFLVSAVNETKKYDVDLMVRPFAFDTSSISYLLSLGIKWYAVDNPGLFAKTLSKVK